MRRLFGKSVDVPVCKDPSGALLNASDRLDKRVARIDAQIKKCDDEISQLKLQLQATRSIAGSDAVKQRALAVLRRKKMYESQRENMLGTQFNVDQAQMVTEQLQTTAITVDAMKTANTHLKDEFKKINIGEIERVQDDLADLMVNHEEVNEILSRNFALPQGIDDGELEAEFAALAEERLVDSSLELSGNSETVVPSYLPASFPSVPTAPVGVPHSTDDAFGLKLM